MSTPSPTEPENEPRSGYEGWLDGMAGERVRTGPIFLVWAIAVAFACGLAYVLGVRAESELGGLTGLISVPYWFFVVPAWLGRRSKQ